MTMAKHIADRLTGLGAAVETKTRELVVTVDGVATRVRLDPEWEAPFDSYRRARSSTYDVTDWSYTHNASVEVPLTRLDPDVYRDTDDTKFTDDRGNVVTIHRASHQYMFGHFDSADYERYFSSLVKVRLKRETKYARAMNILFRAPVCATYAAAGRRAPKNLKHLAFERMRSCLAKLAIERHACYEISKPRAVPRLASLDEPVESDWKIPRATYEPNLVNYYKVARASPFPSQSFLAYYHVLEYFFLRVAEDALHHQLRTYLNRTDFRPTHDGLDKVIALIRRHSANDDETDMLRRVLQRFVPEEEFIAYVTALEEKLGEKRYSKRRTIFGEALEISLKEGHALSNAARVLKQIRNAIVHSSDRYKREECHIPLTESEDTIGEFTPLVKYFAEQVIYGTAAAAEF
jgi:hypothetical protein